MYTFCAAAAECPAVAECTIPVHLWRLTGMSLRLLGGGAALHAVSLSVLLPLPLLVAMVFEVRAFSFPRSACVVT